LPDRLPDDSSDLHSALPAVLVGALLDRPDARVAYVLSDGGALPLWYSHTVAELRGLLCGTVSTGQAFGGDLEAVTAGCLSPCPSWGEVSRRTTRTSSLPRQPAATPPRCCDA
jgi:hypothetical protein